MSRFEHFGPVHFAFIMVAGAILLFLAFAPAALASVNPSGTGQPNASCGAPNATVAPTGFATSGFAHAEEVYAGSGESVAHAGSDRAVSQYDVACYQLSNP